MVLIMSGHRGKLDDDKPSNDLRQMSAHLHYYEATKTFFTLS
jgi:hypothetical protein